MKKKRTWLKTSDDKADYLTDSNKKLKLIMSFPLTTIVYWRWNLIFYFHWKHVRWWTKVSIHSLLFIAFFFTNTEDFSTKLKKNFFISNLNFIFSFRSKWNVIENIKSNDLFFLYSNIESIVFLIDERIFCKKIFFSPLCLFRRN